MSFIDTLLGNAPVDDGSGTVTEVTTGQSTSLPDQITGNVFSLLDDIVRSKYPPANVAPKKSAIAAKSSGGNSTLMIVGGVLLLVAVVGGIAYAVSR